MDSIDSFTSHTLIIRAVLALSPHSPSAFSKGELMDSFSEAVSSLGRELEIHLDVLVHHDKGRVVGVDVHIARVP